MAHSTTRAPYAGASPRRQLLFCEILCRRLENLRQKESDGYIPFLDGILFYSQQLVSPKFKQMSEKLIKIINIIVYFQGEKHTFLLILSLKAAYLC